MDTYKLLEQVKNGELSIAEAEEQLKKLPYEDIGCAKIDHHRSLRSGFGEVIYSAGKTVEQMRAIYRSFYERRENVMGTRASRDQYLALSQEFPEIEYDETARILGLYFNRPRQTGCVAVCTGGTSDIPVAEEAAQTAEYFGCRVNRIYDVGVAGIHRLISKLDDIRGANCVIAVAGMEGALPGVVAGLVERPVIAVPTSIGYGANFQGIAPLLTMLNSCAEGIATVNIDNGFGAGYLAAQMNRLAGSKS
ncbi:nickel pincer cofactor biosynthesis protein LarB [Ruminococcus gauvreauii]|uniref:Nickel pincer cofactor biosynthesis protein LarB n=1 Tax=Ruminococcus gauvreauii TaxID=438033 RepID=A0ABY5VJT2_9FIRM|nr:nickel pincer cofactor biosynthesis protein LarB [Ruminococcus gauvreauii]UWP59793.1 nickel pincer cofactor biosynthesis protein LarB [Ruminococcus gauvreauii]